MSDTASTSSNGGKIKLTINLNTILNSLVIAGVVWLASFLSNINTRLTRIEITLETIKQKVP